MHIKEDSERCAAPFQPTFLPIVNTKLFFEIQEYKVWFLNLYFSFVKTKQKKTRLN